MTLTAKEKVEEKLNSEIEDLRSRLTDSGTSGKDQEKAEKEIKTLKGQIEERDKKIKKVTEEADSRVAENTKKMNDLKKRVEEFAKDRSSATLKKRLSDKEGEVNTLAAKVHELESQLERSAVVEAKPIARTGVPVKAQVAERPAAAVVVSAEPAAPARKAVGEVDLKAEKILKEIERLRKTKK